MATTAPENNDLIGWMRKNNRAARAARTLVAFSTKWQREISKFIVLTTTWTHNSKSFILSVWYYGSPTSPPVASFANNKECEQKTIQTNLDYPDTWGLGWIVRIIESPDNRKYEYQWVLSKLHGFILVFLFFADIGDPLPAGTLLQFGSFFLSQNNWLFIFLWREWIAYILRTWWIRFDAETSSCSSNHSDWTIGGWNALVTKRVSMKRVQIYSVLKQNKFSSR